MIGYMYEYATKELILKINNVNRALTFTLIFIQMRFDYNMERIKC